MCFKSCKHEWGMGSIAEAAYASHLPLKPSETQLLCDASAQWPQELLLVVSKMFCDPFQVLNYPKLSTPLSFWTALRGCAGKMDKYTAGDDTHFSAAAADLLALPDRCCCAGNWFWHLTSRGKSCCKICSSVWSDTHNGWSGSGIKEREVETEKQETSQGKYSASVVSEQLLQCVSEITVLKFRILASKDPSNKRKIKYSFWSSTLTSCECVLFFLFFWC